MFKKKWVNETNTPTYNSWKSMRARILSDACPNYKTYKTKNIKICDRWIDDYDAFFSDMGSRPFGTTLDRIDGDGNYEPSNCRWASHRVQQNNKDSLTEITHNGATKTIGEWAYELELSKKEISKVYKRHSMYGCCTFDELFHEGSLLTKRTNERKNLCLVCARDSSAKWRKAGRLCNTCYHRALRWSKKTNNNIEEYSEWEIYK